MVKNVFLIEILKELMLDAQETKLQIGLKRRLEVTPLVGKAVICIGVRRCGKSTFMMQIMQNLLDKGISKENIIHLNFFDDRLHTLPHHELGILLEAYYSLYPEKKNSEKIYCFFDELQVIPDWEPFIDRLLRTELCEVYITGSSAHLLSLEIATQMRGRALSWELFPFSFQEFLDAKQIENTGSYTSKQRFLIQKAFEDYWVEGGFPEVVGVERSLRIKVHQEYFNAILFRDLIERHDIAHPRAVIDLAHYLVDNTGALYSINNLVGYLKSLGHKVMKTSVTNYLEWFEDAYIFFTVRLFDPSHTRAHANPKKIYCIDHALVNSVGSGILVNSGHLLENLVFMTLRRISTKIYYYRSKKGHEVDFIFKKPDQTKVLIQVCETLLDPQTRKRELLALNEAMEEQNVSSAIIVTRREEDELSSELGQIRIIPIWKFCLFIEKNH